MSAALRSVPAPTTLGETVRAIVSSADAGNFSGEADCLALGEELARASASFGRTTAGFESLDQQFTGSDRACLNDPLEDVCQRMARLRAGLDVELGQIDTLVIRNGEIASSLADLRRAARTIAALAINARIEAAAIATLGGEVSQFAIELVQLAARAQAAVDGCSIELAGVDRALGHSRNALASFETLHRHDLDVASAGLAEVNEALRSHHDQIRTANAEFTRHSKQIEQNVGSLVMGLQIGDSTRQRVEHVFQGLDACLASDAGDDGSTTASMALATRLLRAASDAYDTEAGEMTRAIKGLIAAATDMQALVKRTSRDDRQQAQAFADRIRSQIEAVLAVARTTGDEWARVDALNAQVLSATQRLNDQLKILSGVTAEMAVISINAVLKAGRVGSAGRGFNVIANQVREYANWVVSGVEGVAPRLDELVTAIQYFVGLLAARKSDLGDGGRASAEMALDSFDRFTRKISESLEQLMRDGASGLRDLQSALPRADAANVTDAFDRLIDQLDELSGTRTAADGDYTRAYDVEEVFAGLYTMQAERDVHRLFWSHAEPR